MNDFLNNPALKLLAGGDVLSQKFSQEGRVMHLFASAVLSAVVAFNATSVSAGGTSPSVDPNLVNVSASYISNPVYVVGDSHGVAIKSAGGFLGNPVSGAPTSKIATQVAAVPNGSTVVVSSGNNDFYRSPEKVASAVQDIVNKLHDKDCHVVLVVFPPIDLNGQYAQTYSKANYNSNYNQVRRAVLNVNADHVLELTTNDINSKDSMKIHATSHAYKRIADAVKLDMKSEHMHKM